jgi:hypothetical protein
LKFLTPQVLSLSSLIGLTDPIVAAIRSIVSAVAANQL